MKHLVEDKEEQFTKTQVLELDGSPVRDEGYDKELSELEVKLQQQLDSFVEEIQYLKLCLEEKHSELDAVKCDLVKEKTVSEELLSQNRSLQQQQQLAAQEVERLNKELEARKSRVKELWSTNCEQLKEFDQAMLVKDQELQSLRSLLLSKSQITYGQSTELFSTLAANMTRPFCSTSRVSETLPNVGELLFNVPAAQTTSVTLTHSVPTLLSSGGATRFPPPIQFDYRPRLVTTGLIGVGSTPLNTSGSMSHTTDTNIAPITCSCPPVVPAGPVYTTQPVQR